MLFDQLVQPIVGRYIIGKQTSMLLLLEFTFSRRVPFLGFGMIQLVTTHNH